MKERGGRGGRAEGDGREDEEGRRVEGGRRKEGGKRLDRGPPQRSASPVQRDEGISVGLYVLSHVSRGWHYPDLRDDEHHWLVGLRVAYHHLPERRRRLTPLGGQSHLRIPSQTISLSLVLKTRETVGRGQRRAVERERRV